MTANHVLGLEVVLPDGEVVRLGGDSLEEAGPDLTGLFVGSEGLFGVALEITRAADSAARGLSHGARLLRHRCRRRAMRSPA